MTGQELHAHCEAWREWCITRRYFLAPGTKNLLARMQPARVGPGPDAILSDEMSFFNMAVHALVDMNDADGACFIEYYWNRARNIKKVAAEMSISRVTFYERKRRFAERAYSMSQSLKRAHLAPAAMPDEPAEIID